MTITRAIGTTISAAAAMLLALCFAPAPTAASAAGPQVVTFEGAPYHGTGLQSRPKAILMSGDGSEFMAGRGRAGRRPHVGRLRWSTWTGTDARAWGAWWTDNCTPDCVHGLRIPYQVNVETYRPEVEHGHDVFTRMKVTFRGKDPVYPQQQVHVYKLRRQASGFFWG
jgi:hypothetical protein